MAAFENAGLDGLRDVILQVQWSDKLLGVELLGKYLQMETTVLVGMRPYSKSELENSAERAYLTVLNGSTADIRDSTT